MYLERDCMRTSFHKSNKDRFVNWLMECGLTAQGWTYYAFRKRSSGKISDKFYAAMWSSWQMQDGAWFFMVKYINSSTGEEIYVSTRSLFHLSHCPTVNPHFGDSEFHPLTQASFR